MRFLTRDMTNAVLFVSMCPRRVDGASDGGEQVRRETGCVLTLIYLMTSLHVQTLTLTCPALNPDKDQEAVDAQGADS